MTKHEFHNRIRSMFCIDGYLLPELSEEEQGVFMRDPVGYFIRASDAQANAIWREIERRQMKEAA